MKIFKDRKAAGKLLAERLKDTHADLVLGIPRGGVVVAAEVAKKLKLPLDIIVTRKIGVPNQPELALGAIDPDGEAVFDQDLLDQLRMDNGQLKIKIQEEWKELKRREDLYGITHERGRLSRLEGKTVILIDDGMATGATVQAAVRYLKRHGASIILAIPVASKSALEKVTRELASHPERAKRVEGSNNIIVMETPDDFRSVGQFYHEFEPVEDEEVVQLLS
ncbi:hypothetical protein A3F00_03200 [Candidatus Daviesbacteria bacterium RIFCSPHIGHO2_12_FULL_37_11]|uniref:Phosphoribosyltransferase domain-containing protein n=1 Tax=Candidatus Daviesbacteria bacterium RIFCSPHIGHO2_12_FULL_37_11 TaxID=1797777 RepID=A0A1F5KAK6_9BACT|nr:MAG: hypothetical protein A2769_03930 [Candidatus Daviesbacteria bacterium RIFCSPHIGHO2_01_FULL_37_27]OGE37824.1 MAG: hypothetical protein A3F00_03200 [Candidatus Daviesbacteria bacterium RIFCSPHIGHO2_12_FULL_37_11]